MACEFVVLTQAQPVPPAAGVIRMNCAPQLPFAAGKGHGLLFVGGRKWDEAPMLCAPVAPGSGYGSVHSAPSTYSTATLIHEEMVVIRPCSIIVGKPDPTTRGGMFCYPLGKRLGSDRLTRRCEWA